MNETIFNLQRFAKVPTKNLTTKADDYTNTKSNIVINALAGNDTVSNTANKVTISGGDGNDLITSIGYTSYSYDESERTDDYVVSFELFGKNDSISGGKGNDTIKNIFNNSKTDGGAGNDYLIVGEIVKEIEPNAGYYDIYYHYVGDKSIVKGGEGNDTLEVYGTKSTIEGGADNDSIEVYGDSSTISGGTGNDIISLNGSPKKDVINGWDVLNDSTSQADSTLAEVIKYASGDGKDTVVGFTSNDTLKITSGTFSTVKSGKNVIVKVGKGSINLKDAVGQTINIVNEKGKLTTIATRNDISNTKNKKAVNGTKAEDYISNTGKNVTIKAAAGNDTIENSGVSSIIDGGKGDDSISNSASNVKINGGAGNDFIKGGRQYIKVYGYGDGSDGDEAYYYKPGITDITISAGSGNDTIENSQNKTLIDGGKGNDYIVDSYVEVKFEEGTLENEPGEIETWSDSDFDSVSGWAARRNENTVKGGAGDDTIKIYGAYTTVEGGKGNDSISLQNTSTNTLLKYASGDGDDTILGFSADDTLQITKGSYTVDTVGSDFVVKVGSQSVVVKLNHVSDVLNIADSSGSLSVYNDWKVWNGSIDRNKKSDVTIAGSKKADTIGNAGKNVLITGKGGNDSIKNSGENVLIEGNSGNDSIENSGDNVTIDGGKGNDVIENGRTGAWGEPGLYDGGKNLKIYGGAGNDSISNIGENATIDGGSGNDTIYSWADNVSITGGAGNDSIQSLDSHATISGGKGNDYIEIENYDEESYNVIQYASGDGNDTIWGFGSDDTLQITKGSFETLASGNDFILNVGKGSVLLKDALPDSYTKIYLKDASGNDIVYNDWKVRNGSVEGNSYSDVTLAGSEGDDTIRNSADDVLITGNAGDDSIENNSEYSYDGSNVTISGGAGNDTILNKFFSNVTIDGGAGNDSISNFGYNSSNVTISGGAGNDTIESSSGDNVTINGGTGKDYISLSISSSENTLIQYAEGDGNDTIVGFGSDDTLQISGTYTTKTKGKDVIVTVGKGTIRLKGAKGTDINIVTAEKTSQTAELFAEDNFAAADNLSEIVENNLSAVSEIQTQNFDTLTQENLITFAK